MEALREIEDGMTIRELCELCEQVLGPGSHWGDEIVFSTRIDGDPFLSLKGSLHRKATPYQVNKVRNVLRLIVAMKKGIA